MKRQQVERQMASAAVASKEAEPSPDTEGELKALLVRWHCGLTMSGTHHYCRGRFQAKARLSSAEAERVRVSMATTTADDLTTPTHDSTGGAAHVDTSKTTADSAHVDTSMTNATATVVPLSSPPRAQTDMLGGAAVRTPLLEQQLSIQHAREEAQLKMVGHRSEGFSDSGSPVAPLSRADFEHCAPLTSLLRTPQVNHPNQPTPQVNQR